MPEPYIEVRRLAKDYTGGVTVHALADVSFTVLPGEVVALTGPSGSGKTTLLNLIGGLDEPTSGDILIDGRSIVSLSDSERTKMRRSMIGFIFQFFNLLPTMSALDNVALPLLLDGTRRKGAYDRAEQILSKVGLENRVRHRPDELSGGEQQRVAIARALAFDPVLVLADEPTGNLDSKSGMQVMEMITSLARDFNKAVVLVTHDPKCWDFADRIVKIVDGKVVSVQNNPRA